jgi:RHS repeat-associated protein
VFREQVSDWDGRDGLLYAADINSDRKADFVRLAGYYTHISSPLPDPPRPAFTGAMVQTAEAAQEGGDFILRTQDVPEALQDIRYRRVTIGDADGDGRDDLLYIVQHEPHPATACAPELLTHHLLFVRVPGNGDGTFRFLATWDSCEAAHEADVPPDLATQIGIRAPDVNGDGLADFLIFIAPEEGSTRGVVADDVSPGLGLHDRRWTSADINALGRQRSVTYPDGETVVYGYDPAGRLFSMSNFIEAIYYDASDRPAEIHLARRPGAMRSGGAGWPRSPSGMTSSAGATPPAGVQRRVGGQWGAKEVIAMTASASSLFAADRVGRLHVRAISGPDQWREIDDEARLFAVDRENRLFVGDADTIRVSWRPIGLADNSIALAAIPGMLFSVTPTAPFSVKPPSHDPGEYLFDVTYERGADGLIDRTRSTTVKLNTAYKHDDLGRVELAQGEVEDRFVYDDIGNITVNARTPGSYIYPPSGPDGCGPATPCARPHAVQSVGTERYEYDANGNMTSRRGRTIAWDEDNRPVAMQNLEAGWTYFTYDAHGQRVTKQQGPKKTYYYGPLLEYVDYGSGDPRTHLRKYYYAGSRLVARSGPKTPPGPQSGSSTYDTYWYHPDHLGSIRLLTSWHGWLGTQYAYTTFGERSGWAIQPSDNPPNDIGFTGLRHDEDTGLVYMNARYYDPQLARFISPDSLIPDPLNPQALNPYAYVYNAPLSYTDPTGHQPETYQENMPIPVKREKPTPPEAQTWRFEPITIYGRVPSHNAFSTTGASANFGLPQLRLPDFHPMRAELEFAEHHSRINALLTQIQNRTFDFSLMPPLIRLPGEDRGPTISASLGPAMRAALGASQMFRNPVHQQMINATVADALIGRLSPTLALGLGAAGTATALSQGEYGEVAIGIAVSRLGAKAIAKSLPEDAWFPSKGWVDMRGAPKGSAKTAAGFPRNRKWFFKTLRESHPEFFSDYNKSRIARGLAPHVDDQWVQHFPEHALLPRKKLIHHHLEIGPWAAPLPEDAHSMFHGPLHNIFLSNSHERCQILTSSAI